MVEPSTQINTHQDDHYNINIDDPSLPKTCDVKEALTEKMQQLDNKIY